MTDKYTVIRAFSRPEPSGVKTYEVGASVTFDTPEQATYHVDAAFVVEGAPLASGKPARGRKPQAVTAQDPDADGDGDDADATDDDE